MILHNFSFQHNRSDLAKALILKTWGGEGGVTRDVSVALPLQTVQSPCSFKQQQFVKSEPRCTRLPLTKKRGKEKPWWKDSWWIIPLSAALTGWRREKTEGRKSNLRGSSWLRCMVRIWKGETRGFYFSLAFFFFFFYNRINNIAPRFFSEKAASYEQELCEMSAGKNEGGSDF